MADLTVIGLRVLREVAARGSFTAAADALGYTQSAVSRQMAALESATARTLVERRRDGVVLTSAGNRLLVHANRVLAELDAAAEELGDPAAAPPVRLGAFPAALGSVVPAALATLPAGLTVSVREGTTPALVRSLRAGTLDLAVIAQVPPFRPPDAESPALELTALAEGELVVAVGPGHPLAGRDAVEVAELEGQTWVASGDALLGTWPGLRERPEVRYVVRDWLGKLRIVAAGLAITTVSPHQAASLPEGVRTVAVRGEPVETRRLTVARLPGPLDAGTAAVIDALHGALA